MSEPPGIALSFAFQPIVDIETRTVFAYEALARGARGEPIWKTIEALPPDALHRFDRDARAAAIACAGTLSRSAQLSLNFLPRSLDTLPDAISSTLEAAERNGFAPEHIILEVTEGEVIQDLSRFAARMNAWRSRGLHLAIDDFGAGYSGLNLLADFQPDIVKLDMHLVRGIESNGPRQAIARAVLQACSDLGIDVIAEGVETEPEFRWFRRNGVRLFQGYFFGRPELERLAEPVLAFP